MPKLTAKLLENLTDFGKYDDGDGLRLVIRKSGKAWVLRYQLAGKRKEIGLGPYPRYGLKEARSRADTHRALIREGIDPLLHRAEAQQQAEAARIAQEKSLENTFRTCALDYIETHRPGWKNAKHAQQWTNTLTTYAFPVIGDSPVNSVDVEGVLNVLKPIWTKVPETARRVRNRLELVLDYAKAKDMRRGENPARWRGHLEKLLPSGKSLSKHRHHPAMPWQEVPTFMQQVRTLPGIGPRVLEFIILTAVRTSEALNARWEEFDLGTGVWTIPEERMKAGLVHRVPLTQQAVALLKSMQHPSRAFVFEHHKRGQPASNMIGLMQMRRMGQGHFTVHGFRSSFRDWCAECTSVPREVAEMALAHAIENRVEAAYRRGDLFNKRKELMQKWADYLDRPTDKVGSQ
ncbi:Prophage CP4-57 integrase [compost metagenome]|uniref:tyrosine-type recombinase/integrase n=1 Tax=Pseudomonas TaxID=286 RepID=UPI000CE5D8BB|nr:integrase arm-type DNA-binding domain-containing protein [Pseudomonas sp. SWI44]AVD90140.1 integrase [Pseudomonas sp. SWI44]